MMLMIPLKYLVTSVSLRVHRFILGDLWCKQVVKASQRPAGNWLPVACLLPPLSHVAMDKSLHLLDLQLVHLWNWQLS